MLMTASVSSCGGPKGRPPLRACPDDFDVIFVEQGRLGCEAWYRASRSTVNRWMEMRGSKRLIEARAAYVAHQRSRGEWTTRQTRMVEHREVSEKPAPIPVRDKRRVSLTLARHAAQHLRIVRNGGFIVSPTGDDDWWVGSRRYSAAQMLDLAEAKGFDRMANQQADAEERKDFIVNRPELLGTGREAWVAQRKDGSTYIPNSRKRAIIERNLQPEQDPEVED